MCSGVGGGRRVEGLPSTYYFSPSPPPEENFLIENSFCLPLATHMYLLPFFPFPSIYYRYQVVFFISCQYWNEHVISETRLIQRQFHINLEFLIGQETVLCMHMYKNTKWSKTLVCLSITYLLTVSFLFCFNVTNIVNYFN